MCLRMSALQTARSRKRIVAYLPHARTVEPQKQPFLSTTRINSGTAGLRNKLLANGSVNTSAQAK